MDTINRIPQGPSDGNAVYFIKVTRNVNGTPTDIFVATDYMADMPTYVATIPNTALGANKNHATLVNKVGSGKTVRILNIYATPALTAAIVGITVTLEVHGIAATNPSAGTVITIRKYDTGDPNLPAEIEARGGQGVALTATPQANWNLASGGVNNEETVAASSQQIIFNKEGSALILREGEGILVRQLGLAGVGNIN